MRLLLYVFAIVAILYFLRIPPAVSFVHNTREFLSIQWNAAIIFVTTFRETHPWAFILLLPTLFWLMPKGDDDG